ncbi:MAG: chemotaxis protein CheW [Gallionella sp.]|nr:chemotaxis protein CheW [Gallionella sp.]
MGVDVVASSTVQGFQFAEEILICRVGGVLTGLGLSHIERTISLVAIQPMPSSADYVVGLMNFAGSSLPVIDLAMRLGLPTSPYTLDTPIIVCLYERQRMGMIVQDIVGIRTLQDQDQQLTDEFSRYGTAFCASAHTDLGLVLMLDAAWLTQSELYPIGTTREH